MRAITTAAALGVLLAAHGVAAQDPPPQGPPNNPPADTGSGSSGSGFPLPTNNPTTDPSTASTQMDFSSDGSDGAGDGSGSMWMPTPIVSSADWGLNWTWKGSSSDDGSMPSMGSAGSGGSDEPDIEVVLPGIDADLAASRRKKYFFDAKQGFVVHATQGAVTPGNCAYSYCMHLVFESDYGAMTPFDAFVLDRYESAGGPVGFSTGDWGGGPVPLVLGSMSSETLPRLGSDWEKVLNWDEARRTTWTLHPTADHANEIDLTLSLRQLYTYLPGYPGTDISSNGPFYSADLSDQVIIRVNAQVASAFAGASAMLPIVVDHIGSQLVDIGLTSSLLYKGNGVSGGNEIQLTFKLTRRKYGGALPWYPATASAECKLCADMPSPDVFFTCLEQQADGLRTVVEDLLSFKNDRTSFDVEPFAEKCFSDMLNSSTSDTTAMPMSPLNDSSIADAWQALRDTDAALRCWAESQCNLASESLKADGQVVLLHRESAHTKIDFDNGQYSFYLQLSLSGASSAETVTTQVLKSNMTPAALETAIAAAFPDADKLALDIEVLQYDNTDAIKAVQSSNERLMDEYNKALQWTSSSGSAIANAGSDESSGSDHSGSSGSGTVGSVQPQPPKLKPVPSPVFTLEIFAHNITVVPHVVAVYSNNLAVPHTSTDNVLHFQVAPLDVSKFTYVPPNPAVDLTWRDEPTWKTEVRSFLSQFTAGDAWSRCSANLEACLFDEDCASGVNMYLADALSWTRLATKITTSDAFRTDGQWIVYNVNASEALFQARSFFPPRGLSKLEELFMCMSANQCNLDAQRVDPTGAAPVGMPPTLLTYRGAQTEIVVGAYEIVKVFDGQTNYSYTVDGGADAFRAFLQDVVLRWAPDHVRNMDVRAAYNGDIAKGSPPPNSMVQYTITWNTVVSPIQVTPTHATSSASSSYAKLELSTTRTKSLPTYPYNPPALVWSGVQSWFAIFRKVPFGMASGGSNGNPAPSNPTTNPTTTTPSVTSPSQPTICTMCSALLMACLSDTGCSQAAKTFLAVVLPDASAISTPENDMYLAMWNTGTLNVAESTATMPFSQVYKDQLLGIMECVAKYSCAVGYGKATTGTAVALPTMVVLMASRAMYLPQGTACQLQFKQSTWTVDSASNFDEILSSIATLYGEKMKIQRGAPTTDNMNSFTFSGSRFALSQLMVVDIPTPGYASAVMYAGAFLSPVPAMPSWDGLRSWFNPANPTPVNPTAEDELCAACLPKFQACYSDHECWRSVQEVIVPVLQGTIPSEVWDAGTHHLYSVPVGSMFQQQITNAPTRTAFTTTESWQAFRDILQCFTASSCDMETMESAVQPPATAHIPSYLKFQPARIELMLYTDTVVETTLNGQQFTYTETGSGSTSDLEAFLGNAFGPGAPPFGTTVSPMPNQNAWSYTVTFVDDVVGIMPELRISSNGQAPATSPPSVVVKPWQLTIESYDQFPEWDKLLSLLSLNPPSGLGATAAQPTPTYLDSCANADTYKHMCHQDFTCWYLLTVYALPTLTTALQTPADFITDLNAFEKDLTATLVTQVMWKKSVNDASKTTLLRLIYETTQCASGTAKPVFQNPRIKFSRPAQGALQLEYQGQTSTVHDDDTTVDGKTTFQNFFHDNVIAKTTGNPGLNVLWSSDGQQISYDVELIGMLTLPLPHLTWSATAAGERSGSLDSPWRLSFQSQTATIDSDAMGWLAWLGTTPM